MINFYANKFICEEKGENGLTFLVKTLSKEELHYITSQYIGCHYTELVNALLYHNLYYDAAVVALNNHDEVLFNICHSKKAERRAVSWVSILQEILNECP
jgi:hypothetical protein